MARIEEFGGISIRVVKNELDRISRLIEVARYVCDNTGCHETMCVRDVLRAADDRLDLGSGPINFF